MKPETWTTYRDVKNRYWMVIDLDYWGLHEKAQPEIQRVVLAQVAVKEPKIERPSYGEFLDMVEKGQMKITY